MTSYTTLFHACVSTSWVNMRVSRTSWSNACRTNACENAREIYINLFVHVLANSSSCLIGNWQLLVDGHEIHLKPLSSQYIPTRTEATTVNCSFGRVLSLLYNKKISIIPQNIWEYHLLDEFVLPGSYRGTLGISCHLVPKGALFHDIPCHLASLTDATLFTKTPWVYPTPLTGPYISSLQFINISAFTLKVLPKTEHHWL